MKRILLVGCGDIALRVAPLLRDRNHLFGLVRNAARHAALRDAGITPVPGDLDDAGSLHRLAGLAHTVLHFAPPPSTPPLTAKGPMRSSGVPTGVLLAGARGGREGFAGDTRTRNLLAALSQGTLPQRLVYISTSGVYGDCAGAYIAETHPLNAHNPRALRRVDAENQIRNWSVRNRVNASILRVPGIYAADRLPLQRLQQDTPAIVADEDSYTNHIHADDLALIVLAAMRYAKPNRVYHASDNSNLKMGDYFDEVADAFGLPRPPRLPRAEVKRAVTPALWSFMNESRRLTNDRMKQELKVVLRYPTVWDALKVK